MLLTYLPVLFGTDGCSTLLTVVRWRVAKASQGHFPLPFLISDRKELVQRYGRD